MLWLYYAMLLLAGLLGLFLTLLSLPGLWFLAFAAGIFAWVTDGVFLGVPGLMVLLGLALLAEILESGLGGVAARAAGGSIRGMLGAIVGGIIGGIIFTVLLPIPVIGTLVGACIGSFAGAFGVEVLLGRTVPHATNIGLASARGRLLGVLAKVTVGVLMWIVLAIIAIPIGAAPTMTNTVVPVPTLSAKSPAPASQP